MSGAIANFLNQKWVKVVSWVMIVIGIFVQLIDGVSVVEINEVVQLIAELVQAFGLVIMAIAKLLQKKATTNK